MSIASSPVQSLTTVSRALNADPTVRADLAERVHEAVRLLGYRRDLMLASALRPGLTVVAQAPETLGLTTTERLLARLDGDRAETRTLVVPTELIARGSGELLTRTNV
jgi:LacI family transcriptional regulator